MTLRDRPLELRSQVPCNAAVRRNVRRRRLALQVISVQCQPEDELPTQHYYLHFGL